jgi:hypothetical protein
MSNQEEDSSPQHAEQRVLCAEFIKLSNLQTVEGTSAR